MSYYESRCRAGRTMEHALYYSIRHNDGRQPSVERRGKKERPTSERQAAINRKRAEINLTRVLNANFGKNDLYVTYSYAEDRRPKNAEEFRQQARQLLKRLRKAYKAAGIPFRYVWVAERGERGAAHIHMVQSGIGLEQIRSLWGYGYITVKPMDASGSYHKLAAYFMKYSDKTMHTEGRLQGKRYNVSKNLVRPVPEKTRVRKKRRFDPDNIRIPAGWYLDKETVEFGIQENGYEFLRYTLVMLPGWEQKKGKRKRPGSQK